jgi:hypothetical protein
MAEALVLWIVEHFDDVACADWFSHGLQRLLPSVLDLCKSVIDDKAVIGTG